MARSSTTRHGNGAGKGPGHGPAKGGGNAPAKPFTAKNQPAPEAKSAGKEVAAEARERIAARVNELLDAQFGRALDPSHPQGHQAAADLLNRVMPPVQKQELTGADGTALGFVIYGEREAEDAEAWQKAHPPPA